MKTDILNTYPDMDNESEIIEKILPEHIFTNEENKILNNLIEFLKQFEESEEKENIKM
jgi:hypothetical protein